MTKRKTSSVYYNGIELDAAQAAHLMNTKSCYQCSKCNRVHHIVDNTTTRLYLSDQVKTVHTLEYDCDRKGFDVSAIIYCTVGDGDYADRDCAHCVHGGAKLDIRCDVSKMQPRVRPSEIKSLRVTHTLLVCLHPTHKKPGEFCRTNYVCPEFKPKRKHRRRKKDDNR